MLRPELCSSIAQLDPSQDRLRGVGPRTKGSARDQSVVVEHVPGVHVELSPAAESKVGMKVQDPLRVGGETGLEGALPCPFPHHSDEVVLRMKPHAPDVHTCREVHLMSRDIGQLVACRNVTQLRIAGGKTSLEAKPRVRVYAKETGIRTGPNCQLFSANASKPQI